MTAEQIRKLAAAGLTTDQIAAVAEAMKPPRRFGDLSEEEQDAWVKGIKASPEWKRLEALHASGVNDLGFYAEQQTER